jgi:hypothetical protein
MRTRIAFLIATAAASLGACAANGAYTGGGIGLAGGYGYNTPYGFGNCGNYVLANCGWYGDYFYPGSGLYMYDRGHNRRSWTGGGGRPASSAGITPVLTPGSSGGAQIAAPMPRGPAGVRSGSFSGRSGFGGRGGGFGGRGGSGGRGGGGSRGR